MKNNEAVLKKQWIRGTWIAPRDRKSVLPPPPNNLCKLN